MVNKDKTDYLAVCPNCGTELLRGKGADNVKVSCRKCRTDYSLTFTRGSLSLKELKSKYNPTA